MLGADEDEAASLQAPLEAHLFFGLGLLDVVPAHFDAGGEDGPGELHDVHPQQVAELLCDCRDRGTEGALRACPDLAAAPHQELHLRSCTSAPGQCSASGTLSPRLAELSRGTQLDVLGEQGNTERIS